MSYKGWGEECSKACTKVSETFTDCRASDRAPVLAVITEKEKLAGSKSLSKKQKKFNTSYIKYE
jgi:hypothetical protein